MTTQITLKNAAGVDTVFHVVRQPSAGVSAILQHLPPGSSNRQQAVKIELSTTLQNGRATPVASVAVPYGKVVDGVFEKIGQVNEVRRATQPSDAQPLAIDNAEAFARGLAANAQVIELFKTGHIS